jgi:hypothetical protein
MGFVRERLRAFTQRDCGGSPMRGAGAAGTLKAGRPQFCRNLCTSKEGSRRMMIKDHVMHAHRAAVVGVLGGVAYVAIGVWAVVNFVEADWVMGGIGAACVLAGVPKLISAVQRMRGQERRSPPPAHPTPG